MICQRQRGKTGRKEFKHVKTRQLATDHPKKEGSKKDKEDDIGAGSVFHRPLKQILLGYNTIDCQTRQLMIIISPPHLLAPPHCCHSRPSLRRPHAGRGQRRLITNGARKLAPNHQEAPWGPTSLTNYAPARSWWRPINVTRILNVILCPES